MALCPNCKRDQLHHRHQGGMKCTYCSYSSLFPHIRPKVPQPLPRLKCPACELTRLMRYPKYDVAGKVLEWVHHCRDCGHKYNPVQQAAVIEQQGYKSKVE